MLDKMNYALTDIQITYALVQIKNSSFFKRAILRMISIRVPDLIRFAREVNNASSGERSSAERRKMKGELNALDTLYQEYMAELRNKFGGHLKDVDFFERIQLWSKVNEDDMLFFVSHVEEFVNSLAERAGLPLAPEVDSADEDAIRRVSSAHDVEGKPMIASDSLALSRYNTAAAIQVHELPAKANLLSSLSIIINYEISILREIRQLEVVRAFKCLLLVDVINFLDNLFTRPVDPNAKQAMEGFDVIVERHGLSTAMNMFRVVKTETKIIERAETLRSVRNIVAAHLDHNLPLTTVVAQLDGLALDEIAQVYELMNQFFHAVCKSERALDTVLLRPTPLVGVIAMEQQPESGFKKDDVPLRVFPKPSYTTAEMDEMWTTLLRDINDIEVLGYFRRAMTDSPVIDMWSETYPIGEYATRTETNDIHAVDEFLQDKLEEYRGDEEKTSVVIHVIVQAKSTFPNRLLRILENEYKNVAADPKISAQFILAFGELASVKDGRVLDIIAARLNTQDLNELYVLLTALMKIDVHDNGLRQVNRDLAGAYQSGSRIDEIIQKHLFQLSPFHQTVLSLTMLSELWLNPSLAHFQAYSGNMYFPNLELALRTNVRSLLSDTHVSADEMDGILVGITNHAYSWMALRLGDMLKGISESQSRTFYKIIASDYIRVDWRQDGLVQIRAIGLARLGEFSEAVEIGLHLCNMKPHLKDYRLFALQLAAEGKLGERFEMIVSKLEHDFVLDAPDIAKIETFKSWL